MENLKDLEVFKKISLKELESYVNKYISENLEVGNRYDYNGINSIHYTIMKNIKKVIAEVKTKLYCEWTLDDIREEIKKRFNVKEIILFDNTGFAPCGTIEVNKI